MRVFEELKGQIHGMIHCSGGGQTKVMHFMQHNHVIKDDLFDTPILFRLIQEHSETAWKEMYQVFNMGHRLELYLSEQHASAVVDIAHSFGIAAKIIGRVEASEEAKLSIHHRGEVIEYNRS